MSDYLDQIQGPADLKKLSIPQLQELAEQIREYIISTVGNCGGHLGSNLGAIELTLAMHYVFDFERDKLLWDVGHQCYTHKIITGRKDAFAKLRKAEGVSGFPNPAESPYDQFTVGHAGTAVPTAIGMALGQSHMSRKDKIIAFVGDASVVNGVSFEGLNNLAIVKRQMLVVLNDNSMAIDVTQGAMAKFFSRIRLSQTYEDMRKTTNDILEHMPIIGKGVEDAIERIKKGIRMTVPASQIFESLNIPYFGPVDGHDIGSLVEIFKEIGHVDHPVILHAYTHKGKGFEAAEQDCMKYHSTGPFTINGEAVEPTQTGKETFTDAFGQSLVEIAKNNGRIIAITSAMGAGTGLGEFREQFPDRFYDVGIAESAAVTIAGGMAKEGLKPIVCIYSTFLQRSFDQIFQEVSLQDLPVIFCIDRAGMVGSDGPTHHGLMDIGFLRMMPNVVVAAPSDAQEMKLVLEFAVKSEKSVAVRYAKEPIPADDFDRSACQKPFEMGKSVVVKKADKDPLSIVSYGSMLTEALKAAEKLSKSGIEVEVINARFAAPIDDDILTRVDKGRRIITVEEHAADCGFGSALLERATELYPDKTPGAIRILGAAKHFIKHDGRQKQLKEAGISAENIIETAKSLIKTNK